MLATPTPVASSDGLKVDTVGASVSMLIAAVVALLVLLSVVLKASV